MADTCRVCALDPSDLDALGHDLPGHRARTALRRAGLHTRRQVEAVTDERLLAIPGLGAGGLALARRLPALPLESSLR